MNLDIEKLQASLCTLLCAQIALRQKNENLLAIETPFFFPDGDPYQIYLKEMPNGIFRLSDMGHTMLHLSYDNDVSKFREGTRGKLFDQIKAETFLEEEDGEFYFETQIENLGFSLFRLGQALTKISDLTFLNRARAESTFYEDLQEQLLRIVGEENVVKDYHYSEMENSHDYPIDFKINGKYAPLFLFGIPNRDKARLTTIILERLLREKADFDSILVFSDQATIPKSDLARLSNVGGEMIASLDAESDFSRKLLRKVSLN
jgi:ribosomal protein S8